MGPESEAEEKRRISLKTKNDSHNSLFRNYSGNSEDPLISVIIPAFNEERNIGSILERTHKALKKMEIPYEVIVVNDGSDDLTPWVAVRHGVTLINNNQNLGKGNALRLGFEQARGNFLVTMDADGSHQPEEIPNLLCPALDGDADVDVVIGSRFNDRMEDRATTKLHILGNKIFNAMILLLTGKYVTDSQSGFRVYKRDALKELTLSSSGYAIETEIAVKMLKNGFVIEEVPITCNRRNSGISKMRTLKDGFEIFKTILTASFC